LGQVRGSLGEKISATPGQEAKQLMFCLESIVSVSEILFMQLLSSDSVHTWDHGRRPWWVIISWCCCFLMEEAAQLAAPSQTTPGGLSSIRHTVCFVPFNKCK
jgi:hypothetical protein